MNRGYVLDFEVSKYIFLFKNVHNDFDSIWSLWVFSPCFMIEHSGIIDDSGFRDFHQWLLKI